jgi:hypothetical protein
MKLSFKEFLNLDKEEQTRLGTFNEDLSENKKKTEMKKLEKLLKSHDWWWFMSDSRQSYKKGEVEQEKIRRYIDLIGADAMKLYKTYGRKAGVMEMVKV